MTEKMLTHRKYQEFINSNEQYRVAFDIARANSVGNVWLIGGGVYRTLAYLTYGVVSPSFDFDFIVEQQRPTLVLPSGWSEKRNRYGNLKLVSENMSIDLIPMDNIEHIVVRKIEPTFENLLAGTPLDVQSIGYNLGTREIIGEIGFGAINNKMVGVNDSEQLGIYAKKKDLRPERIIKDKASELGFRFDMRGLS